MVEYLVLFLLGASVGSFLNVLIDRLPRGEAVIKGRSYCESCKKNLAWYDLIPAMSFVLLRGRCRYCHSPISFYYPVVEFVTGLMFVLTFFLMSTSEESAVHLRGGVGSSAHLGGGFLDVLALGYYLFILSSLIVIFFTDLKYGIIPDVIILFAVILSLPYLFINHPSADGLFLNHLFSGIGSFLFFLTIFLITRGRGMGFGDVKLAFLMGLILGFPKIVVAFYIAFLTGAFVSVILILCKKKRLRGDTIPFGPFLVFGTLASLYFPVLELLNFRF